MESLSKVSSLKEEALLQQGIEPNSKRADEIITRMTRWASHPWAMIEEQVVYTLEGTNFRSPIKPFPPYPWLREVTEIWLREPLTAWPKSRRMMMSWLMVWNHLWLTMFREGISGYIQSETEEKSHELLERAEFIYNHIPNGLMIKPKLKGGRLMWCHLGFPGLHSFMKGVAQGANQLRQFTCSFILGDEIAFWPKAQESIGAFKPTVEGGGKITLISSAQAGPFRDLCYDMIK